VFCAHLFFKRDSFPENCVAWTNENVSKRSKLTGDDLELVEILKIEKPSVSLAEIMSCLEEMHGLEVSMATVSRALKHRLPSGLYTRKKSQRSPVNALHKQTYFIHYFTSIIWQQKIQDGLNSLTKQA